MGLVAFFLPEVLFLFLGDFTPAFTGSNRSALFANGGHLFYSLLLIGEVGLLLQGVVFYLFYRGFARLKQVQPNFSSAATLALVALVGLGLLILGFALFIQGVEQMAQCSPALVPTPPSCPNLLSGETLAGIFLLLPGAILLILGFLGVLFGLWRVGERYQRTGLKVAAILLIIPFLGFVGSILILADTSSVLSQMRTVSDQAGDGPPPSLVPPLS